MNSSLVRLDRTADSNQVRVQWPRATDSYMRRSMRAFFRDLAGVTGLVVIVIGLLMAITPLSWLPHDPTENRLSDRLQPPAWSLDRNSHMLGTDVMGRDIFSRLLFGARWTYLVSVSAVLVSAILGTLTGLASGFYLGRVDAVVSRLIDMQLAFPAVLLAISVLAVAGPSIPNMILVLGLVDWARYARVIRGSTISVRERGFVEAATACGASSRHIILRHILPNVLSSVLVLTTFSAARLMLTESALSFLGLGVTPPATTWGGMIGVHRDYLYRAPWTSVIPGLVITVTVLAINLLGDGLRDAFDPQGLER